MQSRTTPRLYKYIRPLSNRSSSSSCNSIWVLIAIWDKSERVKVYRNTFYPTAPCALLWRQSVRTLASHDLMVVMATASKRQRWRVAASNYGMFRLPAVVVNCCTLDDAPRTRRAGPVHTDWTRIWRVRRVVISSSPRKQTVSSALSALANRLPRWVVQRERENGEGNHPQKAGCFQQQVHVIYHNN